MWKHLKKLTRYPNLMVDNRAWMMDHKPQNKWDARENLQEHTDTLVCSCFFNLTIAQSCLESPRVRLHCCLLHLSSPVDLHVQLLLHLHLVLWAQVVEALVGLTQVAFNKVELRTNISVSRPLAEPIKCVLTYDTHLLGLWRVVLGVDFEVRKLIAGVVVHPFTEMVANVESPAREEKIYKILSAWHLIVLGVHTHSTLCPSLLCFYSYKRLTALWVWAKG